MAPRVSLYDTEVDGCKLIETPVFEDHRGTFFETWNRGSFLYCGLPTEWLQDNFSFSKKHVFRGLHIQRNQPQGKLVRAITGKIIDYCLDLRSDSPTFMKVASAELSGSLAFYCPPGTAHGFYALEECRVYYKCTTLYDKDSDGGVSINSLGLSFPSDLIISDKDKALPSVEDWLRGRNK